MSRRRAAPGRPEVVVEHIRDGDDLTGSRWSGARAPIEARVRGPSPGDEAEPPELLPPPEPSVQATHWTPIRTTPRRWPGMAEHSELSPRRPKWDEVQAAWSSAVVEMLKTIE